MKSTEIIKIIKDNGGFDISFIEWKLKQGYCGKYRKIEDYLTDSIKEEYGVHGNIARAVAKYFC